MGINKDIADELKELEALNLSKGVYETLILLFNQCYLEGRLRGIEKSQSNFNDFIHHVVKRKE